MDAMGESLNDSCLGEEYERDPIVLNLPYASIDTPWDPMYIVLFVVLGRSFRVRASLIVNNVRVLTLKSEGQGVRFEVILR